MDNQLEQRSVHEQALYRYIAALEGGDLDTLAALFYQAEQDETLARMIEEVHVMYQTEEDVATSQDDALFLHQVLENSHLNENQVLSSAAFESALQKEGSGTVSHQERERSMPLSLNAAPNTVFKRLKEIGLKSDFVQKRLFSASLIQQLQEFKTGSLAHNAAFEAAKVIEHVFKLTPAMLFGADELTVDMITVGTTRFKKDLRQELQQISAYTVYAHYLAQLVLKATTSMPQRAIPTQPEEVREAILSEYGELSFATTLHYVWNLGIPVLPLSDRGAFHGACWRVESRNVIVLKQQTASEARWLFDLLHELRHAGQDPNQAQFEVIEGDEALLGDQLTNEEKTASSFAGDVVLHGRAEELTQLCVQAAHGRVERLKSVVPPIARREHVAVDALANYLAFRLSLQNINWWPVATILQTPTNTAWPTARELLLQQVHLDALEDIERQLLLQAL
jgi:hypothetical protein